MTAPRIPTHGGGALTFSIPGEPCAQGRPRTQHRGRNGQPLPFVHIHEDSKSTSYKGLVQFHAKKAAGVAWEPIDGPVRLRILAIFGRPKSKESKRKPKPREWKEGLKDWDNIGKIVSDALEGVAYFKDKQVSEGSVRRLIAAQGELPAVYVTVESLASVPAEGELDCTQSPYQS